MVGQNIEQINYFVKEIPGCFFFIIILTFAVKHNGITFSSILALSVECYTIVSIYTC